MMTPRHAHAVPVRSTLGRCLGPVAAMVMALALLGLGACSVDRRSDEYARCTSPSQCPSGMCDRGWCVPIGEPGNPPDATPGTPPDATPEPGCPAVCTECNGNLCIIECDGPGTCPDLVVCPPGRPCEVECQGDQSCADGVSCSDATSCDVSCSGVGTCGDGVTCGPGPCQVECRGFGACQTIDCSESCACDTDCANGAACALSCPDRGGVCQRNAECSSASCNEC
jgi:hypothetical protein